MKYKYKLGFIGSGNMANAILNGILKNNLLSNSQIIMSASTKRILESEVEVIVDNDFILSNCEYVIFAVKPQIFNTIAQTFKNIKADCLISIMAGINTEKIKKSLNFEGTVVRIMPNTPSRIGFGMSVVANNNYSRNIKCFVDKIFSNIGKILYIDENKFDAVTSISGSGPAYVYYFINAMIKGGIEGGLNEEESKMLTLQTFEGATKMIELSSDNIELLIEKVCSKGGTTIQAIESFESNNLENIIKNGIRKCRCRSEEMSK